MSEKSRFNLKSLASFQALESGSDLEKVSHNVNGTILNTQDLLSSADTVLTTVRGTVQY